ncbi:MAG: rhodanese-like domain-containing protein [Culicoidibacterales bacterium]
MKNITIAQLTEQIGTVELIDVREPNEYICGHIPTAKNIPCGVAIQQASQYFNKETVYYIVCQVGGRSAITVEQLEQQGYQVVNVEGGTMSWTGELV